MKRRRPLGQNFLNDPEIADLIVNLAQIRPESRVVEIGPGRGILTGRLLDRAADLLALEIDPILCQELKKKFGKNPNFHLIHMDALKYDYGTGAGPVQVVSNLPYYAATPILKRLIDFKKHISDMTLMLQKEVVERLTAVPGTRDYGSLSVYVQYHCQVERMLKVGRDSFTPAPKVESAVIRVTPRAEPAVTVADPKTFFKLVHVSFLHKRKTLRNNFKGLNKYLDVDVQRIEASGIDLNRRGETLSLEDFAALANLMTECP